MFPYPINRIRNLKAQCKSILWPIVEFIIASVVLAVIIGLLASIIAIMVVIVIPWIDIYIIDMKELAISLGTIVIMIIVSIAIAYLVSVIKKLR